MNTMFKQFEQELKAATHPMDVCEIEDSIYEAFFGGKIDSADFRLLDELKDGAMERVLPMYNEVKDSYEERGLKALVDDYDRWFEGVNETAELAAVWGRRIA